MTRAHKIISIIFTIISAGMVMLSGIMKFLTPPDMKAMFAEIGVAAYLPILGTMEIVFAVLFIFPKTMRIGFILLSCYFAGAMATDLSHARSMANAMMPIVLVWIAAFLRDKHIFLPENRKAVEA